MYPLQQALGSIFESLPAWLCRVLSVGCGSLLLLQLTVVSSNAQVVPDGTLPTTVDTTGSSFEVTGGVQRESNLFHSFDLFSIQTGETVDFQIPNDGGVRNVFSRVTGRVASRINGTVQVGGSANLFLINPNGIIFGPTAALNVGGSFLGSTASSLVFADRSVFHAIPSQSSALLTMSAPVGLQFGNAPGSITNQSNAIPNGVRTLLGDPVGLGVRPNQTLALIGGAVISEGGHLTAPQGRVELGSVASDSTVGIKATNQGWELNYTLVDDFQDIRLGPLGPDIASINANGAGGTVRLIGRNITQLNTPIFSFTTSAEDGGFLEVMATGTYEVDGSPAGLISQVGFDPQFEVLGNGGSIRVQAQRLLVQNGGLISSATSSQGQAGSVNISVSESVEVIGGGQTMNPDGQIVPFPSLLTTATDSSGAGGLLNINASRLIVRDGGDIVVRSFGAGPAGMLNIFTDRLILDQGDLTAATVFSNGGNISLQVSELLLLRNGSQITAASGMMGDGGNVAINAGLVFAVPNQDSDITANAFQGNGGNIAISTQGLFGIAEQPAIPGNGTNDIDASSEFGLAGGIEIDTVISDPDAGLVSLPEGVSDPSQKIAIGCAAKQGNRFVLAGRGGVPPSPLGLVSNLQPWKDTRDLSAFRTSQQHGSFSQKYGATREATQRPVVEATGWRRDAQGRLMLVNQPSSPHIAGLEPAVPTC